MRHSVILGLIPLMLSGQALALDAKYTKEQIPNLSPEPQHKVSTTRLTGLFTRTHFKAIDLNDEFSNKIANF